MSQIIQSRRLFLRGLISVLAAPAIVSYANIMPVRRMIVLPNFVTFRYFENLDEWCKLLHTDYYCDSMYVGYCYDGAD